jgi:transposase InsO family protein
MKNLSLSISLLFATDQKYEEIYRLLQSKTRKQSLVNYAIKDGKIYYTPLHLEIVKKSQVPALLQALFQTDTDTKSKGVKNLYYYLASKYGNITRKDIETFLANDPNYLLTHAPKSAINKPQIAHYANQIWSADLIDMSNYASQNNQYRYILNVIDIFSRKVWLKALKTKTDTATAKVFQEILDQADITPDVLKTDNGGEFLGNFQRLCEEKKIKHIFTESHTPTQNAVVERANQDVRKIIRYFFLEDNNFQWKNKLERIEQNKNQAFNASIKGIPEQIWTPTKKRINTRDIPKSISIHNKVLRTKQNILEGAEAKLKKYQQKVDYQIGDEVRVKMSALFANIRAVIKAGNSKQIVVHYSPEIFRIANVLQKKNKYARTKYTLENSKEQLLHVNGKDKYFFASDLLPAGKEKAKISMAEALKLNKVERNNNDVAY